MAWRQFSQAYGNRPSEGAAPVFDEVSIQDLTGIKVSPGWPALVDTASDLTVIPISAAAHLGMRASAQVRVEGAENPLPMVYVQLCHKDFGLLSPVKVVLMEQPFVRLGRDCLSQLILVYDGPGRRFLLRQRRRTDGLFLPLALPFDKELHELRDQVESQIDGAGLGSGGYIVLDLPDSTKALFHDVLKGFEDYAKLRGYSVSFSIDNSFSNKIAFKFTVNDPATGVSHKQIRRDLKEYIDKVQKGLPLDDLPIVLPVEEHNALLVSMKDRINLLQHSYTLQKNILEFQDALVKRVGKGFGVSPIQNFYFQSGEKNEVCSYHAENSPQAIQGSGNRLIGNHLDQGIHVDNSFNGRKAQIETLQILRCLLMKENWKLDEDRRLEANKWLEKVSDELAEEQHPDPSRIQSWLEKTKNALSTLALTKEVTDALKAVWEAFKILS